MKYFVRITTGIEVEARSATSALALAMVQVEAELGKHILRVELDKAFVSLHTEDEEAVGGQYPD